MVVDYGSCFPTLMTRYNIEAFFSRVYQFAYRRQWRFQAKVSLCLLPVGAKMTYLVARSTFTA